MTTETIERPPSQPVSPPPRRHWWIVATVAAGYADGIPWALGNRGEVTLRGRRVPIVGRISMDSLALDCGDEPVAAGDEVVLFGAGGPSASELAAAAGTIAYDVVTGVGSRVPRVAGGAA